MSDHLGLTPQLAADAQVIAAAMSLAEQRDWPAAASVSAGVSGDVQRLLTAFGFVAGRLVGRLADATCSTRLMVLDDLVLELAAEAAS